MSWMPISDDIAHAKRSSEEIWESNVEHLLADFDTVNEAIYERSDVIARILIDGSLTRADVAEEIRAVVRSYVEHIAADEE